jgi:hypothetical protein
MAGDFHFRRLETPNDDIAFFIFRKGEQENKMKKSLVIAVLSMTVLAGCIVGMKWPKTSQGIIDAAEVSEDTFNKTKWVSFSAIRLNYMTDMKKITGQSTWSVPMGYYYVRTLVNPQDNVPKFFQIYFSVTPTYAGSWSFFNKAIDKDGAKLKFIEIDKQVTTGGGVEANEQFAITFDKAYLEQHKNDNLIIKVYGKRDDFTFYVPQYYLEGVYNYFYKETL